MSGRPPHLRNLAVGQSVRHGRFGIGKVVAMGRIEDRETATVDFGRLGLRVLDVDVARLLDPGASTQPHWERLVDHTAALEPPSPTLRVRHDPSVVAAVRAAGGDLGVDDDGLSSFSIAGMSAWLPAAGRGDLVDFRGQVAAVQTIALPPGQRPAWKLRLRAWRAADADGLLDVVFEASVWPAAEGPAVGSDVQGRAWLVGEVLGPA